MPALWPLWLSFRPSDEMHLAPSSSPWALALGVPSPWNVPPQVFWGCGSCHFSCSASPVTWGLSLPSVLSALSQWRLTQEDRRKGGARGRLGGSSWGSSSRFYTRDSGSDLHFRNITEAVAGTMLQKSQLKCPGGRNAHWCRLLTLSPVTGGSPVLTACCSQPHHP